jgi:hypothetical protein
MADLGPVAQNLLLVLGDTPMYSVRRRENGLHGRMYEVMDGDRQRVLCRIKDARLTATPQTSDGPLRRGGAPDSSGAIRTGGYAVEGSGGKVALWAPKFRRQEGGGYLIYLSDAQSNQPVGHLEVDAPRWKGVTGARWTSAEGQPLLGATLKGPIVGPDGNEVCSIRRSAWALRDIWELEIKSGPNRLYSLVFAVIWECERMPRATL